MGTLFDDTYTGIRYTYGSKYRPFTSLMVWHPDWIIGSNRSHSSFPNFGTFDSSTKIDDDKVNQWELVLV